MHFRRLACFLLGSWLMGSILTLCVTSWNSDVAEALAGSHSPETAKLFAPLRGEQARMLAFHVANESGRSYAAAWETMQIAIGLGAGAALFLERRTRYYTIGIALMLLLALFEGVVILPQLEWLGRSVDFVSWKTNSPTRDQYWNLRAVFLGLESMKLLIGFGITGVLLIARTRSRSQRADSAEAETNDARPQSLRKTRTSSRTRRSRENPTGT